MLGLNSAVGRPSKYNTVDDMQVKIDEYFEECKGEIAYNEKRSFVTIG